MLEDIIYKIKPIMGTEIKVIPQLAPAHYIVDGKIVGVGYLKHLIPVKPHWYITMSEYLAPYSQLFNKVLLHYLEEEKLKFTRCHSYYIDKTDLEKKGGSNTSYELHEIITSLINHALSNNEKTCAGCRGEDPLQTHYIQLI